MRAIDVYIECRNSKTTPKLRSDVYVDTVDSTLAVYVEFLKINTFYGILKIIWTVNDLFFCGVNFSFTFNLLESKKILWMDILKLWMGPQHNDLSWYRRIRRASLVVYVDIGVYGDIDVYCELT